MAIDYFDYPMTTAPPEGLSLVGLHDTTGTTPGYYGGANVCAQTNPPPPTGYCFRDVHYFECKHERFCYCKRTSRLPLTLDEGI